MVVLPHAMHVRKRYLVQGQACGALRESQACMVGFNIKVSSTCGVCVHRGQTEQLLHKNALRYRGGLVFKAHTLCVSLDSRLEGNKE